MLDTKRPVMTDNLSLNLPYQGEDGYSQVQEGPGGASHWLRVKSHPSHELLPWNSEDWAWKWGL